MKGTHPRGKEKYKQSYNCSEISQAPNNCPGLQCQPGTRSAGESAGAANTFQTLPSTAPDQGHGHAARPPCGAPHLHFKNKIRGSAPLLPSRGSAGGPALRVLPALCSPARGLGPWPSSEGGPGSRPSVLSRPPRRCRIRSLYFSTNLLFVRVLDAAGCPASTGTRSMGRPSVPGTSAYRCWVNWERPGIVTGWDCQQGSPAEGEGGPCCGPMANDGAGVPGTRPAGAHGVSGSPRSPDVSRASAGRRGFTMPLR